METKFGVQTLHGKCYLCIKPRVLVTSGAAEKKPKNETALLKIYWIFLRRLNPIARKPVLLTTASVYCYLQNVMMLVWRMWHPFAWMMHTSPAL